MPAIDVVTLFPRTFLFSYIVMLQGFKQDLTQALQPATLQALRKSWISSHSSKLGQYSHFSDSLFSFQDSRQEIEGCSHIQIPKVALFLSPLLLYPFYSNSPA